MNTFNFKQTTTSVLWEIQHDLGSFPASDVMVYSDGKLQKAFPRSVEYVDPDRVAVHFTEPQTGEVRLVGLGKLAFNLGLK